MTPKPQTSPFGLVKTIAFCAIIGTLAVCAVLIIIARASGDNINILGNQYYVVSSGSMRPTLQVGDIIHVKEVKFDDLEVGDIVSFRSTLGGKDVIFTHRIKSIDYEARTCITRGDANYADDPEVTADRIVGRMTRKSAVLTFFFNIFTDKMGFFLIILLPIFILLLLEVLDFINSIFAYLDDKKAEKQAEGEGGSEGSEGEGASPSQ